MRALISFFIGGCILISCTNSNEIIESGPFELRFSQDTVLFDTLFTEIKSVTKRFRVYNDDSRARSISSIRIAGGSTSAYRIALNGLEATEFNDQVILGGDSLLFLVEANIDAGDSNNPFIVEDSVIFESAEDLGGVKLLAWGQDANYLKDSIISCDDVWDSPKPYVLLGSVLVDSLCTLTIPAGANIFSAFNTSFFVQGSIAVLGEADNKVVFRNDRLDEGYRDAPGQWEGIFFLEGSGDNLIEFAEISNSRYGIWLGTPDPDTIPDLVLRNSIITNVSNTGLIAFTSDLSVENSLIHNCGEQVIANLAGGNYAYNHCTLVNYPFQFFREEPLAVFADFVELADGSVIVADIDVSLLNCIVDGSLQDELVFSNSGGAEFTLLTAYNLIRSTDSDLEINENILNSDPIFIDPENSDYQLGETSPAVDTGIQTTVIGDLAGNVRDAMPDRGAYERIE